MLDIARNLSASASVHALTGSSRPGAVPPLVPLDTSHPDAAVIDLAGRVKRLAARENRVVTRTCRIQDAAFVAMRDVPKPLEGKVKSDMTFDKSVEADGTRVTVIREPATWTQESQAIREEYEAALAAREQRERAEEERRNLPYWMKLRERAGNRLYRWILQLAAMQPSTQAGLAAKAAAVDAIVEDGSDKLPCDWHQDLAASLARDVVRLAVLVPAMAPVADLFETYHAEIVDLQATIATTDERSAEQEAAWARWKELDGIILASRPTTLAGAIGALQLAQREHHQFSIQDRPVDEIGNDDRLIHHLLTSALDVLGPLVQQTAPAMANLRSAPLPSGLSARHLGTAAATDVMEWYRSWLYGELRMLDLELDGSPDSLAVRQDNPGAEFHFPAEMDWRDVPKPSTRAAAVLGLLGIMPEAAGKPAQTVSAA